MLADGVRGITSGSLRSDLHREGEWLDALVDFMLIELPGWRDWPGRRHVTAETKLTSQLCSHLNSAATLTTGLDSLSFVTEYPDPISGRPLDVVSLPRGRNIWVAGRRHTHFDPLLPIECKRLPTPRPRDKREYLRTARGSTGGVQRFKDGHHGAASKLGLLIAYVQSGGVATWSQRIGWWIQALARAKVPGWSSSEGINQDQQDLVRGVAAFTSVNVRSGGLVPVRLRHLWIEMN